MRSSVILTTLCAGLAIASPLVKKAMVTDTITETIVVYITEEPAPATEAPAAVQTHAVPTVSAAPVAEPTTTPVAAVVVPAITPSPVAPATTAAPPPPSTTAVVGTAPGNCEGTDTPTDYESTAVYWHNIHRCNHTAPAVTYDSTIAGYAAQLAATCNFHHDVSIGGGGYGQNIASYGATGAKSLEASALAAQAISNYWYSGELNSFLPSYYGEATPDMSNFEAWGHFSQVVWAASTKVGCATQYCPAGGLFSGLDGWFTVCNYAVEGNMGGAYGANIKEPLGHPSVSAP